MCRTHILSNEEYIVALEAKLNEEVAEYQADKNLEEMAECMEELGEQVLGKLQNMTDEEFAEISLEAVE